MKQGIYLSIIFFWALLLGGCGNKYTNMETNQYHELSDNIHILYDIDQIQRKEEVSIYRVEYFRPDTAVLMKELLQYEVKEEGYNAFGKFYFTNAPDGIIEGLRIYDGGEEIGTYSGIDGGFLYFYNNSEKNYQEVAEIYPEHPSRVAQLYKYTLTEDFPIEKELEFKSIKDTIDIFQDIIEKCNLPDMEIDVIYSLDKETMQRHNEIRLNNREGENSIIWTEEDEAYLLYFLQVIDGIPLVNHLWTEGVRKEATETKITAFLSGNGEFTFELEGTVKVMNEIEKQTIISPKEAEQMLLEELNQALQISNIYLETLRLSYVNLRDKEGLKLVPAWVFCIARENIGKNAYTEEMVSIKVYEHFVVNAVTGERIRTEVSSE